MTRLLMTLDLVYHEPGNKTSAGKGGKVVSPILARQQCPNNSSSTGDASMIWSMSEIDSSWPKE
jgi:hypothetical protein